MQDIALEDGKGDGTNTHYIVGDIETEEFSKEAEQLFRKGNHSSAYRGFGTLLESSSIDDVSENCLNIILFLKIGSVDKDAGN